MKKSVAVLAAPRPFVDQFSYVPIAGHDFTDVISITVPDMHLSIQDLISRSVKGLPVPTTPAVNFDGDVSFLDQMSAFDKIDYARRLAVRADELRKLLDDEKREATRLEEEKRFNDAVTKAIAERDLRGGDSDAS